MGTLNRAGIDLIKFYEGCKLEAYPDPGTGRHPWTIGWGHTGPEVVPGLTWTKSQAEEAFKEDCQKIVDFMTDELALPESVNDNQFSAMVSFAYNCGIGTLERIIDEVGVEGFPKKILLYIYAGPKGKKVVMDGLVKRRAKELHLFNTPIMGVLANGKNTGNFPLSNRRYS